MSLVQEADVQNSFQNNANYVFFETPKPISPPDSLCSKLSPPSYSETEAGPVLNQVSSNNWNQQQQYIVKECCNIQQTGIGEYFQSFYEPVSPSSSTDSKFTPSPNLEINQEVSFNEAYTGNWNPQQQIVVPVQENYTNFSHEVFQNPKMQDSYTQEQITEASNGTTVDVQSAYKPQGTKQTRTSYSSSQLTHLENEFSLNKYISRLKRIQLAEMLSLTETQIKVWFQNRRSKFKRELEMKPPKVLPARQKGRVKFKREQEKKELSFPPARHRQVTQNTENVRSDVVDHLLSHSILQNQNIQHFQAPYTMQYSQQQWGQNWQNFNQNHQYQSSSSYGDANTYVKIEASEPSSADCQIQQNGVKPEDNWMDEIEVFDFSLICD